MNSYSAWLCLSAVAVAGPLGASRREIDRMESAFEHEDLALALRFGAS